MKRIILTMAIIIGASNSAAGAFCFEEAGREYNVSPLLLWGLSSVESGFNPVAVNRNADGSYDYCHMQINSSWAKTLGPERWEALADPCQCTRTGAWILSQCIGKYGYTWKAVGCYHSQTPQKRDRYAAKVAKAIRKAMNDPRAGYSRTPQSAGKDRPITTTSAEADVAPWDYFIEGHDNDNPR